MYFKTQLYDENDPWSDEDSEASGSDDESNNQEDAEDKLTIEIKKSQLAKRNSKKW